MNSSPSWSIKLSTKDEAAKGASHHWRQFNSLSCFILSPFFRQYVSDLLEADRKFILFGHHQEMLDAMARLLESKVS